MKQEAARIVHDGSKSHGSAISNALTSKADPIAVWPPPPKTRTPFVFQTGNILVTPEAASSFFLVKYMMYGVGFGAAYGGVSGMLIGMYQPGSLYDTLITTPAGGFLGLLLGIVEGIIMACMAAHIVRKGAAVPIVVYKIRRATPIATMLLGAGIIFMSGINIYTVERMLYNWTILTIYMIALLASWHAARIITRKFMEEYD